MDKNLLYLLITIGVLAVGSLIGWYGAKLKLKYTIRKIEKNVPTDIDKQIEKYKIEEAEYLKQREVKNNNGKPKTGIIRRDEDARDRREQSKREDREAAENSERESRDSTSLSGKYPIQEPGIPGELEEERDIPDEPIRIARESKQDIGEDSSAVERHMPPGL